MGLETIKIPRSSGESGWIVFTYNKNIPVCLWINSHECKQVPCCVDERICGDTFFKVEKVSELEFVVSDIWFYNANCIFACSTFQQRYDWLLELLNEFVYCIPNKTIKLIHKSNYDFKHIIGYEYWVTEIPGKKGYYVEEDISQVVTLEKHFVPDSYEIKGTQEFVKITDMKTSLYLRSKGKEFECRCIRSPEGVWSVVEDIPLVE